jgi:hypothetical protein
MYYIGIDPSMNNTSVCVLNHDLSYIDIKFLDERKKYGDFTNNHIHPVIYSKS